MAQIVLEPRRFCRRLIVVSYAAMGSVSSAAEILASASAGGMFPIGLGRRRLSNWSTHSSVAYPTALKLRHGPRGWLTSALNTPLIVAVSASRNCRPRCPPGAQSRLQPSARYVEWAGITRAPHLRWTSPYPFSDDEHAPSVPRRRARNLHAPRC